MKHIGNLFLLSMLSLFVFIASCEDDDNKSVVFPTIEISIQTPTDGVEGIGFNPTFTWDASGTNPENLKYDFYIGTDETKLGLRAENIKTLEYKITNNTVMKGDVTYYWKVVAKDGIHENESEVWSFTTAPTILAPLTLSPGPFVRDAINFEWETSSPAVGETLKYNVYLGKDNPPTEVIGTVEDAASFNYDASQLEHLETYYWKVEVADLQTTASSEIKTVKKLLEGYPDLPSSISPLNEELIFAADGDVILDWTDSSDPEGETVVYDVYLDTANPPVNKITSFSGDSEYNATASLVPNMRYFWNVVAKDGSGNSYSTEILSFDYLGSTGPAAPLLNEEVVDGTLSLDESLVWGSVLGAASVDVYIDTVNPPVTKVASDVTETQYMVKNSDIPSDITDVKTYYARVVAKNIDGETESQIISFIPQMTGTYTDTRGQEVIEYPWVRLGTQIWMTENLRTKKLTDGTDLIFVGPVVLPTTSTSTELYYDDHPEGLSGYPSPWVDGAHGRVYSSLVPRNTLIAPEGWHVPKDSDISTIQSYVGGRRADIMGTWQDGGTNLYGVNFVIAGFRYNNLAASYVNGFRTGLEKDRVIMWADGSGGKDSWEIKLSEYKFFDFGNEHNRMFGIRLVRD
ncbi:FISUMP domain-containing protein [Flavivirga abyssicola]|uniref:FISUMP domain-containing protein n=1 Tax=Flavivirga abyssicola TaxID=3063533 RepID=UPI0026DF4837|nr:FISUMP domain-containing protein [Flavivirga sp. MEBiC07777]WVK11659.1 FISUMP domain-containing protein [Flavivirga sp. MEBiC07777]